MYRYEEITVGFFNEFSWSEKRLFTINKSEVGKQWNNMMLLDIKTDFCKPFVQFVCQCMTVSPVSFSSSAFSLCITYDQTQIPQLSLKTLHLRPPRHAAVFIPSLLCPVFLPFYLSSPALSQWLFLPTWSPCRLSDEEAVLVKTQAANQ